MKQIYRLTDAHSLLPAEAYLREVRASLKRIEEVLANAEGFTYVDARYRLRNLAEAADSAASELIRTAVARVSP